MKVSSASISKTASVFSSEKISCIVHTTAWTPASCPALNCKAAAACVTSILNNIITALPAILCSTSSTPIGLSPGFRSSGISLQAKNDFKDDVESSSSTYSFLIIWTNVLRKSTVPVPKAREVKILYQPSALRP